MKTTEPLPTAYQILGVHPTAPMELVSTCYWILTKQLQDRRHSDHEADALLHQVTLAYEMVSDSARRERYDSAIGYDKPPLTTRPLPRRRGLLSSLIPGRRAQIGWSVDPYEVLGLDEHAPAVFLTDAYRTMRDQYLRLPPGSRRREVLLRMLDDSYRLLQSNGSPKSAAATAAAPPKPSQAAPAVAEPAGEITAETPLRESRLQPAARAAGRAILAAGRLIAAALIWLVVTLGRLIAAAFRWAKDTWRARRTQRAWIAETAPGLHTQAEPPAGEPAAKGQSAEDVFLDRLSMRVQKRDGGGEAHDIAERD